MAQNKILSSLHVFNWHNEITTCNKSNTKTPDEHDVQENVFQVSAEARKKYKRGTLTIEK